MSVVKWEGEIQMLWKEQCGGTGKARSEQSLFYVSGVEADKLQDNAHIKNAENSQQRPHGLPSENRCTGTDRDEESAGRREDAAWLWLQGF